MKQAPQFGDYLPTDLEQLINYTIGRIALGIGANNLRTEINLILQGVMAVNYRRGYAQAEKDSRAREIKKRGK